jgi:hypothetical protein
VVVRDLTFSAGTPESGSITLRLFANSAETPLACTISGSANSCNSGSATAVLPPGTKLVMRVTKSNSGYVGELGWGFRTLTP